VKPDAPIVRMAEQQDLFAWREEARAVRAMDALIDAAREQLDRDRITLEESGEYVTARDASDALKFAKQLALEGSQLVSDARATLKAARKALRSGCPALLATVREDRKRLKALTTKRTESRDGLIGRVAS
jgi:hypothetical protein